MSKEGKMEKKEERSKCKGGKGGSARRMGRKRVNGRVGEERKERK